MWLSSVFLGTNTAKTDGPRKQRKWVLRLVDGLVFNPPAGQLGNTELNDGRCSILKLSLMTPLK
jgi:hypothetical protein